MLCLTHILAYVECEARDAPKPQAEDETTCEESMYIIVILLTIAP